MKSRRQHIEDAILGTVVADAAAMGLHWLYDRTRLKEVIGNSDSVAFFAPEPKHYQDEAGYFAHAGRQAGDLSHYGDAALFWIECRLLNKAEMAGDWQACFLNYFGPGGKFTGYADRPTKNTVAQLLLAAEQNADVDSASVDDDQNPALNCLLAAVALNEPTLPMVAITHTNADVHQTVEAVRLGVELLIDAVPLAEALDLIIERLPSNAQHRVQALDQLQLDHNAMAKAASTACHLPDSVPLALHILRHTDNFRDAIEHNIRLGGDSCGRALTLGPLAGAFYGREHIPASWLMSLTDTERLAIVLRQLISDMDT